MVSHDTKKTIHKVKIFEITDIDASDFSLKSSKNKPVLSLSKTIKNCSDNEGFFERSSLLIFSSWYFNVPSLNLPVLLQKCMLLVFGSKLLNITISAS